MYQAPLGNVPWDAANPQHSVHHLTNWLRKISVTAIDMSSPVPSFWSASYYGILLGYTSFHHANKVGKNYFILLEALWCKHLLTNENLREAGSNYAFWKSRRLVPLPQIGSSQCFLYHVNGTRSLSFCSHYCKGRFLTFFFFLSLVSLFDLSITSSIALGQFFSSSRHSSEYPHWEIRD